MILSAVAKCLTEAQASYDFAGLAILMGFLAVVVVWTSR